MGNVTSVKSKFFEPQGVSAALVSASAAAATLVIADGGPYGNLTETILVIVKYLLTEFTVAAALGPVRTSV